MGHDVTVYATGDSAPSGRLRYRFARPIWPPNELAELRHAAFAFGDMVAEGAARGRAFDVVHAHQAPSLALGTLSQLPMVFTLHHERMQSLLDFYLDFPQVTYVGISKQQASLVPELGVQHVVHHGLDPERYPLGRGEGGYLAFLGRLAEEKAPHVAIETARRTHSRIRLGGLPHWNDHAYFDAFVKPHVGEGVELLGEVGFKDKVALLGGASVLLFPLGWDEPFGLVMIEAMLMGTPVIAYARGSAPEIVDEGVTGFLVNDVDEMVARVAAARALDRARCRARAVERWSGTRMAREYLAVYEHAVRMRPRASRPSHPIIEGGPRHSVSIA
jgi:glycosyltransferase involved in cell wall biosynthesis